MQRNPIIVAIDPNLAESIRPGHKVKIRLDGEVILEGVPASGDYSEGFYFKDIYGQGNPSVSVYPWEATPEKTLAYLSERIAQRLNIERIAPSQLKERLKVELC